MQAFIGCKIIKATPMCDLEFEAERKQYENSAQVVKDYKAGENIFRKPMGLNDLCGEPPSEQKHREPKDGYKVMYPDGYLSWSPKHVFEQCYRPVDCKEKELMQ